VLKLPGSFGAVPLTNARALGLAGTLLLTGAGAASAQTAAPSPGSHEIEAVKTTTPPVIDGEVGESEWRGAGAATGFIQYEPRRGDASDSQTEALVLYDSEHLYVAFRAWDPEPITAQLTQRDAELCFTRRIGQFLDRMAIAIAAPEIHSSVDAGRIAMEHLFDETDALEELAPVKRRDEAQTADQAGHRRLFRRLMSPLRGDRLFNGVAAGGERIFEIAA